MLVSKNVKGVSKEDGFYSIETDGAKVRVYFLTDDIVRFRASFDGNFEEESYILTMTAWEDKFDDFLGKDRSRVVPVSPSMTEDSEKISFETATMKVVITKSPYSVEIYNDKGDKVYSDLPNRAYVKDHLGQIYHYSKMNEDDCYYGFGEQTGSLNKRGLYFRLSPKDAIGYDAELTNPLYKHIPFYIRLSKASGHALGVFYHNSFESTFCIGAENSGYWHPYSYFSADGGDLDMFFINGPDMKNVVKRYTDLTGKTAMPPMYSLGYLGSTMYYGELPKDCDQEIVGFVDKCRAEDIPVDSFQLSSGYTVGEHNRRYVFTWNEKRFPNPVKFFSDMEKRGVLMSPNVKPGILLDHPYYDDFSKVGGFIKESNGEKPYVDSWWGGLGSFVDFSNPAGRKVWKDFLVSSLTSKGAKSIWNDNCEFEINDRSAVCDADGAKRSAGMMKGIQPNLMAHIAHEALKETHPEVRPYVINRSGYAGIQRYAQTWAGDNYTSWKSLKYNIATVLGMGLSGVANQGCDIGGFAGPSPSAELLIRWVQNGIFQPRFSIHSCNTNNTVTEPWMYGEECTDLIREAIYLRYALIPYYYSLVHEASTIGSPIMRPMVYEFQNDEKCCDESVTFMLGSSILVANVVEEGAESIDVYLPAGSIWYDWYTHEKFEGGQTITIPVAIDSIPMFIREGAIIPMAENISSLYLDEISALNILVVPGEKSSFTLYEDDGKSNKYLNDDYLRTDIQMTSDSQVKILFKKDGMFDTKVEKIVLDVLNDEKGAFWVTVNGKEIPQYLHREKWEDADFGWMYDPSLNSVRVKYDNIDDEYEVVVSFDKFDLIGM